MDGGETDVRMGSLIIPVFHYYLKHQRQDTGRRLNHTISISL
ncbi:unnamed protein product [Periconia digitata]|uniref:Uncharacterized protein n=1 Tax=Periconia digitata TaxID=1303443 RepID=A0A9W4UH06_9PLEO|nr:unnamed protein product [Periconia digitata]